MPDARIDRIGVVVPARDEEGSLAGCLAALGRAARAVGVPVDVVVAVNATRDRSAEVARAGGATVVELALPGVGAARAAGAARLLRGRAAARTWLATTDADSVVPPGWLAHQLDLAAAGADAVVGTIRLADHETDRHAAWWQHYRGGLQRVPHGHVHGANLAVRGSLYLQVGGFAAVPAHEDLDLVTRLDAATGCVVRTVAEPVLTSARTEGRTPVGVAHDLRRARSASPLAAT
ncbi:MAG: glycosyltransferase [Propionibacteriales bacterium]|nr:glycosyltransferase [Propionibacteriales bacterium]